MEERILEIVNIVLKNRGKKLVTKLNKKSHLRNNLGFDSLDLAELTVRIEAEYNVDVFENGLIYTIGEIFQKIEEK